MGFTPTADSTAGVCSVVSLRPQKVVELEGTTAAGLPCQLPSLLAVKTPPAMQEMQETWVRCLGWEDPMEAEMATHPNILAWKIPWTEEPGRLQSTGSLRASLVETGMSGNFLSCSKGVKDPLEVPDVRCD